MVRSACARLASASRWAARLRAGQRGHRVLALALEFELRALEHFATKAQARTRIPAWIDDYNHHRRHSALRMMSPVDYEKTLQAGKAA